jgi:hypothetical protein
MSGPRAVKDLLAVWLAGLPMHEMRAFNDLSLALAFAKEKAELLPPSIDRRCAALINTKLDEAEHWMLNALRAAVDRSDRERAPVTHACGSTDPMHECCGYEPTTPAPPCTCTTAEEKLRCNTMCERRFR